MSMGINEAMLDKCMNNVPKQTLSNEAEAVIDTAVKEIVKKYHKTLIKLADT